MATAKGKGGGQGRVRQYRTGRMVRCVDVDASGVRCERACRFIGFSEKPTYRCGTDPLVPKKRTAKKAGR